MRVSEQIKKYLWKDAGLNDFRSCYTYISVFTYFSLLLYNRAVMAGKVFQQSHS